MCPVHDVPKMLRAACEASMMWHRWKDGEPMLDGWQAIVAAVLDVYGIPHDYREPDVTQRPMSTGDGA